MDKENSWRLFYRTLDNIHWDRASNIPSEVSPVYIRGFNSIRRLALFQNVVYTSDVSSK